MTDNLQDKSALAEKIKRAREAMLDPTHKVVLEKHDEELAIKRQRAREVMEGYERRTIRETKEKLAKQRAQTAEEKIRAEQERLANLAKTKEELAAAEAAAKAAEEKAYSDRLQHIEESESVIESLKKNTEAVLNPLRTLKSDLAKAVQEDHLSLAQISLKEEEKKRLMQTRQISSGRRTSSIVLLLIILALIGGGVGVFLFYPEFLPRPSKLAPVQPRVPSIILAQKQVRLSAGETASNLRSQIIALGSQGLKAGTIVNAYFTTETPAGESRAGLREAISALELDLPVDLLAFLTEDFMLGFYQGTPGGHFMIFKTRSFESTAYTMTKEETAVTVNLYRLFTGGVLPPEIITKPFQDVVVKNHDTRLLRDKDGEAVLVYALLDRETLLITENLETFNQVLESWETPSPTP